MRKKSIFTEEQLSKLTKQRLKGCLRALNKCHETPDSEFGCQDSSLVDNYKLVKSDPLWIEQVNLVKKMLNNIDKENKK